MKEEMWTDLARWGNLVLRAIVVREKNSDLSSIKFQFVGVGRINEDEIINETCLIPVKSLMDLPYILERTLQEAKNK